MAMHGTRLTSGSVHSAKLSQDGNSLRLEHLVSHFPLPRRFIFTIGHSQEATVQRLEMAAAFDNASIGILSTC